MKVSKSLEVDYYEPLSFHQILVLLIKERLKVEFTREPVDSRCVSAREDVFLFKGKSCGFIFRITLELFLKPKITERSRT